MGGGPDIHSHVSETKLCPIQDCHISSTLGIMLGSRFQFVTSCMSTRLILELASRWDGHVGWPDGISIDGHDGPMGKLISLLELGSQWMAIYWLSQWGKADSLHEFGISMNMTMLVEPMGGALAARIGISIDGYDGQNWKSSRFSNWDLNRWPS